MQLQVSSVANRIKVAVAHSYIGPAVFRWRAERRLREWSARDDMARAFYSQFACAQDTIFDVGANCGNRTKIFRELGRRVIAIEPQASCLLLLKKVYDADPKVSIVDVACGSVKGMATLRVADGNTLSSFSDNWINAVTVSKRFGENRWSGAQSCNVVTLDSLIHSYGLPAFVKIDVEGFELEVLKGLSQPVRALSFEFTPETADQAYECIDHVHSLGLTEFNLSIGESFALLSDRWLTRAQLQNRLELYRGDVVTFGDIYARVSL